MRRVFQFSYAALASIAILAVCYIFSHSLLEGELKGSDSGFNLSYIAWLDKFFPRAPFWFPLQGGGVSLTSAYPFTSHILVVLLNRLSQLDLIQSMRLFQFLIVPLTSLGIYCYTWYKLKSQTGALIAGIFYPLSHAAWPWLIGIGLFSQSAAVIYLPWTILFFDLYLEEKKRWPLVLTAILLALTFVTHFITGLVLSLLLFLLAILFFILKEESVSLIFRFWHGLKTYLKVISSGFLLALFWLGPFFAYQQVLGRNGLTFPAAEQVRYMKLTAFLGIAGPGVLNDENLMWYAAIARPVLVFLIAGILWAFLKKNKNAIIWFLIIAFFVFHTILPGIWLAPVRFLLPWFGTISARSILPALVLIPPLAAFGALSLSGALFFFIRKENLLKNALSSLVALTLVTILTFSLKGAPADHPTIKIFPPAYNGYGPNSVDWVTELGSLKFFPKISSQGPSTEKGIKEILSKIELPSPILSRLDFSPYHGSLVGAWNFYSPISQASLYEYASSINHLMWGYQQEVFYNKHSEHNSREVDNLSSLFGLSHVVVIPDADPLERFTSSWDEVYNKDRTRVLRFKENQGLVNLTQKRNILVLGKYEKRAYEQVFRTANLGAINYDQALLTEGKDSGLIDDYTIEELNQFSALILYGYSYKDRLKAMKMLEEYVMTGGRLFIETGWQFVNPDWERPQTEPFFPVARFHWTNFGKSWNIEGFSPPIYQGKPWGVAAANLQEVRSWAEPLVTVGNKVLVAQGSFGRGKVVWSGMNLWGHALMYRNEEEVEKINSLISWLSDDIAGGKEIGGVVIKRENPDRVEFSLTVPIKGPASFYFREAFHPYWQAYILNLEEGKEKKIDLALYRAGPEYMLTKLPPLTTDAKVIFEIHKPPISLLSKVISLLTLIFLLLWAIKPEVVNQLMSKIFRQRLHIKDFSVATNWWNKEEE